MEREPNAQRYLPHSTHARRLRIAKQIDPEIIPHAQNTTSTQNTTSRAAILTITMYSIHQHLLGNVVTIYQGKEEIVNVKPVLPLRTTLPGPGDETPWE